MLYLLNFEALERPEYLPAVSGISANFRFILTLELGWMLRSAIGLPGGAPELHGTVGQRKSSPSRAYGE